MGAECGAPDVACAAGAVVDEAEGPRHAWVSASEAAGGELVALVGPPAEALDAGDDCDAAMGLPAEGLLAIHGSMAGASDALDHADPLCPAAGGGPDRVFGIFAQAPTHIRADVVGVGFEPHVWLRSGQCDDGPLLACGATRGGWSTVEADVEGGLVTLVVDSLSEDAAGDFLIRVHATAADP